MKLVKDAMDVAVSTRGIFDVLALSAGATKGYLDSRGVETDFSANIFLCFVPVAIQAVVGGYFGLLETVLEEGDVRGIPRVAGSTIRGGVVGTLESGLGYCIGYTAGSLIR